MADWTKLVTRVGSGIEDRLDALRSRLRRSAGAERPVQILPYRGFGNSSQIFFKGRVLRDTGLRPSLETDRIWHNVLATYRRFHTTELRNAKLEAAFGPARAAAVTDQEGFFEAWLPNAAGAAEGWVEAGFELLDLPEGEGGPIHATGLALIPPATAKFGIVSDVDDTIVMSHARQILRMACALFLRNARGRVPFEGVAAFYQALQKGCTGAEQNPIFYVSSGPWNLYDLIMDFFEVANIPVGPLFLQDYGLDEAKFFTAGHAGHKIAHIERIMEMYPSLPFILIGDSGQHDPEIYRKLLDQVPNRIKAVYIRNVTGEARAAKIDRLACEAREHGGELRLVRDSLEAAQHAVEIGLIPESSLEAIASETAVDKGAPEDGEEIE